MPATWRAAGGGRTAGVLLHVPGRHQLAGDYHGLEGVGRFAAASQAIAGGSARTYLASRGGRGTLVA